MPTQPYLAVQFNTATDLLDTTPQFAPNLIYPYTPPLGQSLTSSGTLTNGSLVSLIDVAGNLEATLASANASCAQGVLLAHGFVLVSTTNGQPVQVFLAGLLTASIPGASLSSVGQLVYLSDSTLGAFSLTPPLPNKIWSPTTVYNPGDQIVDGNNNWETVTVGGTSGPTEPLPTPPGGAGAWSTVCGGLTHEGGSPPSTLTWQMSPPHYEQIVGTIVYYNSVTNQCTVNFQPLLNIGDVSSVALAMPPDFSVGGSPIVTAGVIQVQWLPEPANTVHAGPTAGGPAVPTWRNSVAYDFGNAILQNTFLAGSSSSGTGYASFRTITVADLPAIPFSLISSGVNITALMTVGAGAVLTFLNMGSPAISGIINANQLYDVSISPIPPTTGQSLVATSPTTANWQTTGTVSGGTGGQIAWYAATGTNVTGDSRLTDNGTILTYTGTGGISAPAVTINGGTPITAQSGTGATVAMTASPTFTGTITAASLTASGTVQAATLVSTGNITATGTVQGATVISTGSLSAGTNKFVVNAAGVITEYDGNPTVGNGVPAEYATSDLTNQTAALSMVPLLTPGGSPPLVVLAGQYRITWNAKVTTPDSGSPPASILGGNAGFQVTYTDKDDLVVVTTPTWWGGGNNGSAPSEASLNTTQTWVSGSLMVNVAAGSSINYSFDYVATAPAGSPPSNAMAYSIHVKLEYLG